MNTSITVNDTWWMQTINNFNMKLLVNNAFGASKVLTDATNYNNAPAAYKDRCVQLHDNTEGEADGISTFENGTNPDIIAVYLGINDAVSSATLTFSDMNFNDDYWARIASEDFVPTTFDEAYALMIYKMSQKYSAADIFLFTIPNAGSRNLTYIANENIAIKAIANHFGCGVVDLASTVLSSNYSSYTSDGVHPTASGMDIMTDTFTKALYDYYMTNKD